MDIKLKLDELAELRDDFGKLMTALARISLVSQNNTAPAHIHLDECGKIARTALNEARKRLVRPKEAT
jgi:hypothetical protein